MVERGRWMNPKVQYIDRKCTLCNDNDIQDEYHFVLKCAYYNEVRRKYIKVRSVPEQWSIWPKHDKSIF